MSVSPLLDADEIREELEDIRRELERHAAIEPVDLGAWRLRKRVLEAHRDERLARLRELEGDA